MIWRTLASESLTRQPSSSKARATVDLPEPMPPTIPMTGVTCLPEPSVDMRCTCALMVSSTRWGCSTPRQTRSTPPVPALVTPMDPMPMRRSPKGRTRIVCCTRRRGISTRTFLIMPVSTMMIDSVSMWRRLSQSSQPNMKRTAMSPMGNQLSCTYTPCPVSIPNQRSTPQSTNAIRIRRHICVNTNAICGRSSIRTRSGWWACSGMMSLDRGT